MHPTLKGFLFVAGLTLYALFLYGINAGMFLVTTHAPVWLIRTIAVSGLALIVGLASHITGAILFRGRW